MSLPAILIPVFNAFEQLCSCLESIEACSPDAETLVIDDASTDPRVRPLLQSWTGARTNRLLLENDRNMGFVHTANRGMSRLQDDVVLLNSDTLVTPGWLEALAACLASSREIATATPWTNNGEIASFPYFCEASPIPPDLPAVAAVFRSAGTPEYPDLPTAVGFCMAISRLALHQAGLFDVDTFGQGYGEENDFSLRVARLGMRNVLCDNAYVAHTGGASFGPLGLKPDEHSMSRLLAKHPGYLDRVQKFIRTDPLAARRNSIIESFRRAGVSIG